MKKQKKASELLLERYISNLRIASKVIELITPVISSFDGKVYNARFKNAITAVLQEKVSKSIFFRVEYFDEHYCILKLNFYGEFREVYADEMYFGETKTHKQVHYLPSAYETIRICYLYTSDNEKHYSRNEAHFWYDENENVRINSEAILKVLAEKQKELLTEADTFAIEFSKIAEYKAKVKAIQKEADELNMAIPDVIKNIFDIKSRASWS